MLHEGTVRASRSLHEDFAKTLRQAGFKRSSRLLREGFAEPPRCLSGESPSRRHRDVFAVPSRRHHYGGFMNRSFEAFVDPPYGFREKPGTRSNREGQFSPPEARMVVEPRMQLLGLCSFDARRKKTKKPPKNIFGGSKKLFGRRTPYRGKQKKTNEVFPLGRRKILLLRRPPKKPIFGFGRRKNKKAAEKKNVAEKKLWGPNFFWGTSKKLFRRRTP